MRRQKKSDKTKDIRQDKGKTQERNKKKSRPDSTNLDLF